MEKLRTIRLYGALGAKFGRVHEFVVSNTAGAVRAMCAMLPGFERELMTARDRGVVYAIFHGKRNVAVENLHDPLGADEIRIAPVLTGNKRGGILQVIVGAVLVIVGAVLTYFGFGAIGIPMMKMGAMLALGGVIQMLSPQPAGLGTSDRPDNKASYNFNGPVNTSAQGNPVPLGYGRMIIGSAVISAGIFSEDMA
ncbi:tail assembly protein [Silvimonas soli]|uniref:tail assembly protein n=1 Tax=Silvimonas soli TaxID=2980100 RepID=UPI0024B3755D|nr:tail assembly protein [Silvimonas soli]